MNEQWQTKIAQLEARRGDAAAAGGEARIEKQHNTKKTYQPPVFRDAFCGAENEGLDGRGKEILVFKNSIHALAEDKDVTPNDPSGEKDAWQKVRKHHATCLRSHI